MGLFDFWKNKDKKNQEEKNQEEQIAQIEREEEIEPEEKTEAEDFEVSRETVEEIVKEVAEEIKLETEAPVEKEIVEEVIQSVENIEEEIAEKVLEEVTETVEEIVQEVAGEIEEETKQPLELEVVEQVVEEVKEIETEIRMEIEEEKKEPNLEESSEKTQKKGFFKKLIDGLNKTRKNILGGVDSVLSSFTKIDEDLFEELEEVLIMADIGVETTMQIIENLRKRVKKEKTTNPSAIKSMLVEEITEILMEGMEENYEIETPTVLLVIGVNGVGKTTTIGKLAQNWKEQNKKVLLAAADTFRAAAIDQLQIWGDRAGLEVIRHEENSDPAAVVFDAVNAAKNRKMDILICDTAGRLHNKKNLMEELKKINKVIAREYPEAKKEVYLVLDATTGQNALQQARLFQEAADISGIILTKLDGTAKGGIVIAIKSELKIPVRYVGVGEGIHDLQKFQAKDFAKALFGEE